jgi:hypothetical protein
MKPSTVAPFRPRAVLEGLIGRASGGERVDIDGIRNHRDLRCRNAPRGDIAAQALADGRHLVAPDAAHGLQATRQAVAQAAFGRGAVIDRRVLPERAHLVDHGHAELRPTRRPGRRSAPGSAHAGHRDEPAARPRPRAGVRRFIIASLRQEATPDGAGRAMKVPAVDGLFGALRRLPAWGGQMMRLPAERLLLAQDGQRAERVAAVQRNRMVQHVQNSQGSCQTASEACMSAAWPETEASIDHTRRNASNISKVHSGAL